MEVLGLYRKEQQLELTPNVGFQFQREASSPCPHTASTACHIHLQPTSNQDSPQDVASGLVERHTVFRVVKNNRINEKENQKIPSYKHIYMNIPGFE